MSHEYQREEEEKKAKERQILEERKKACETGLDVKYDRNVTNFKMKINHMSDKVDINAKNYINFCNQHKNNYEEKKEMLQLINFNNSAKNYINHDNFLKDQNYIKENNEKFELTNFNEENNINNSDLHQNNENDKYSGSNINYIKQLDSINENFFEENDKINFKILDKHSEHSKSSKSSAHDQNCKSDLN